MNKYETGLYQALIFDKYGSKLDIMSAVNFTQAEQIGKDILEEDCRATSYVIVHVLQNSLDVRRRW